MERTAIGRERVNDSEGGTTVQEMGWAFHWLGRREMTRVAKFMPANRPRLCDWLGSLSPEARRQYPLIVAVAEPHSECGHWVCVWNEFLDSLSFGRWQPLRSSEHRRAAVGHAWTITPPPRVAGPVASTTACARSAPPLTSVP
jgi:hypothetical protein